MTESNNQNHLSDETAPAAAHHPSNRRRWWIGGGAVLAAVVLAGGGVAVGAAIADDDDDRARVGQIAEEGGAAQRAVDYTSVGAASAADVLDAVAAAATVADGEPVSIDARRDGGWNVEVGDASGDETDVRVTVDGSASVTSTDPADADDTAPAGTLDAATIDALISAALAETDGRVVDLDVDDNATAPYDVTVLAADGTTTEISFDNEATVIATDRDHVDD